MPSPSGPHLYPVGPPRSPPRVRAPCPPAWSQSTGRCVCVCVRTGRFLLSRSAMCECLRGIFRVSWTPSSNAGQFLFVCALMFRVCVFIDPLACLSLLWVCLSLSYLSDSPSCDDVYILFFFENNFLFRHFCIDL